MTHLLEFKSSDIEGQIFGNGSALRNNGYSIGELSDQASGE